MLGGLAALFQNENQMPVSGLTAQSRLNCVRESSFLIFLRSRDDVTR
jgi:hypothetical protein